MDSWLLETASFDEAAHKLLGKAVSHSGGLLRELGWAGNVRIVGTVL